MIHVDCPVQKVFQSSIENDPDADKSYIYPDTDGKYVLSRSVGDSTEKCVSRGNFSDFNSLVDINNLGWDCADYTGSGSRNPSVSCGCWNENENDKLSGGEIAGITIGVLVFIVSSIGFCRYKSKSKLTRT